MRGTRKTKRFGMGRGFDGLYAPRFRKERDEEEGTDDRPTRNDLSRFSMLVVMKDFVLHRFYFRVNERRRGWEAGGFWEMDMLLFP